MGGSLPPTRHCQDTGVDKKSLGGQIEDIQWSKKKKGKRDTGVNPKPPSKEGLLILF